MDQRERQQARYVEASIEKTLGALPVVADYCRRLDLAGIIDRACPIRDLADFTHGQVIETLIANRLTSSTPLVRVADQARESAVEEVFGIDPALLNDDRLERARDAIAPELDHIIGTVGAQAITVFGIDTSRLHWDMTSISLYGAYDQTDDEYAAPKFGHPKDRRVDLNQIQAGLAVAGDGGIPVFHRAYDGGAGEVAQVVAAMTELTKMTAPRDFLLIGDSKLVSYGNVSAMIEAGVGFIAPASALSARRQDKAEQFALVVDDLVAGDVLRVVHGEDEGVGTGLPVHHDVRPVVLAVAWPFGQDAVPCVTDERGRVVHVRERATHGLFTPQDGEVLDQVDVVVARDVPVCPLDPIGLGQWDHDHGDGVPERLGVLVLRGKGAGSRVHRVSTPRELMTEPPFSEPWGLPGDRTVHHDEITGVVEPHGPDQHGVRWRSWRVLVDQAPQQFFHLHGSCPPG
ncbi:IS1634 family transposase [Streptomyces sp. NPDC005859]|uniref:IS1634 family transposase n=1 Tax=Streptomyces sp. NPDC005859 TaxID=3157170 RepID=UPI00340CA5A6